VAEYKSTFKCTIMTPDTLVYENEVQSLFLVGDTGEFELLPYHYPLIGILKRSDIIIDWKESVPIKFGLIRFFANDCIVLVEQDASRRKKKEKKKEEEDVAISEENEMERDLAA